MDQLMGSFPPLITPFIGEAIDYDTYARLVDRQVHEGSNGILVNGTSAEPSTLTVAERQQVLEVALRVADRRLPVVAATGSQNLQETLELCDHATKVGADALLVVTPFYIRPPQRGVVAYYSTICERTHLPVLMYHIPGRTAFTVTLDTIRQIREICPNFVGMKHAVNDLDFCSSQVLAFGPGYKVFVGLEELSFPMLAVGACGVMNAVGNLFPKRVAQLCQAVSANDLALARQIHYELYEFNKAIFWDTNPIAIKYMMKCMGLIPENSHRVPMMPAAPDLAGRLDALLKSVVRQ
jgi:4-hydroxy-tetrahydrodipicolinate synthase